MDRRRRHEHRVIALLQTVLGPGAVRSEVAVPRVAHSIDALLEIAEPTDLWGPLGPLVAHRMIVVEHESRAPDRLGLHTALGKLAWIIRDGWPRLRAPGGRYPLLLFLSAGCPRWVGSGELGFTPEIVRGVYRLQWPLPQDVVLVHLRGLPEAPGLSLLKLMLTPRDPYDSDAGIHRLSEDPAMLQSTKDRVMEAFVSHEIPATSQEKRVSARTLRQEGRQEGRQEALLALARRLLTPEQLASLEGLEDPDALEARLVVLLGRH
jgi:hypothetical protein